MILKVIIAGAFYPHYFNANKLDILEAEREVGGRDILSTVVVRNLPMNESILYQDQLHTLFEVCAGTKSRTIINFEDTRAYVEFRTNIDEDVKTPVHLGVYLAVQIRMLRLPMRLKRLTANASQEAMRELMRKSTSMYVTYDTKCSGALRFDQYYEDDLSEDDDTMSNSNDSDASDTLTEDSADDSNLDFILNKQPANRQIDTTRYMSHASIANLNETVSSISGTSSSGRLSKHSSLRRLNKQSTVSASLRALNVSSVSLHGDRTIEYLANPTYLLPVEVDQNTFINVAIVEIVECGHFWAQIDDDAHRRTLKTIQAQMNPKKNVPNVKMNPAEIKVDKLCMATYKDAVGEV